MSFLAALEDQAQGRRRIDIVRVWHAFRVAHPVEAVASDARDRLARRLDALAAQDGVSLPSPRGRSWDRTARPPLPAWVELPRPRSAAPVVDAASIPWAPELAFVPGTAGVDLAAALAIQGFLASGGRDRVEVPSRERSVELFGDEKRLERLLRTPLFAEGRLDLGVLRCFQMAPPLVWEAGPDGSAGQPILVVENHHTWWSLCGWNARVGDHSAVVYGAGGGFGRDAAGFLVERCRAARTDTAVYFGDLDVEGLTIPWRASTRYLADTGVRLVPAVRWYAVLLARAAGRDLPVGAPLAIREDVLAWLPVGLRAEVAGWFARGVRIPQELVGTEVLQFEESALDPDVPF